MSPSFVLGFVSEFLSNFLDDDLRLNVGELIVRQKKITFLLDFDSTLHGPLHANYGHLWTAGQMMSTIRHVTTNALATVLG